MNLSITLVALRSLALLFNLQGKTRESNTISLLAIGLESGLDVDAHMQSVADALKSGDPLDWDGAHARIEADSVRLQGA